jgi:hypothetical protein
VKSGYSNKPRFPFDKLEKEKKEKKTGAPWPRHSQWEWPRQKDIKTKENYYLLITIKEGKSNNETIEG